jgi:hypothetical protein
MQYKSFNVFRSHCHKTHQDKFQVLNKNFNICAPEKTFRCKYEVCNKLFVRANDIYSHTLEHLDERITIICPFDDCSKEFPFKDSLLKTKQQYRWHTSTYHRGILKSETNCSQNNLTLENFDNIETEEDHNCQDDYLMESDDIILPNVGDEKINSRSQIIEQIAKFYLRLEAVAHMAVQNVQKIYESWVNFTEVDMHFKLDKLEKLLCAQDLDKEIISKILHEFKSEDLLYCLHHPKEFQDRDIPNLSTDYLRKKYYMDKFDYIAPVKTYIGKSAKGKELFSHYVPISQTLENFLKKEENRNIMRKIQNQSISNNGVRIYRDYTDGFVHKKNALGFPDQCINNENIDTNLDIILYTDDWNPADSLGPAKTKQKITSFYLMIGNILPEYRFDLDKIFLLVLCKTSLLKMHDGKGLNLSLEPLLNDLKKLCCEGFDTSGIHFNVNLLSIMGDNLGAHFIGGFQCNFSRGHICRFCDITLDEFTSCDDNIFQLYGKKKRTPEEFDNSVEKLQQNPLLKTEVGIKSNCLFNGIGTFHCCLPALPPCLAHDLYEGVVDHDIGLYLAKMINKKLFSIEKLNKLIETFPYKGSDAINKPKTLQKKFAKLGGSASQNRTFLRLLPLIVGPLIQDSENEIWRNILRLRRICDYASAPIITMAQINILKGYIEEYTLIRKDLIPDINVRPKHHFLCHYSELITELGPLVRYMTLRQESKHSELKQVLVKAKNYINPTKTVATRHQLYLAYKTSEKTEHTKLSFKNVPQAVCDVLNVYNLQDIVSDYHVREFFVTDSVQYKGHKYSTDHWVFLNGSQGNGIIGKILFVLVNNDGIIEFCLERMYYDYDYHTGLVHIFPDSIDKKVVNFTDIADYYPLNSYQSNGNNYIALKHSITEIE